jgi:hypothetical protein
MTEGYWVQVVGGIPGQPDLGNADPVRQAALQASVFQQNQAIKEAAVAAGTYVAPNTGHDPSGPEWASQPGLGNVPIQGWTVQNSVGSPFPPYSAVGMGTTPDWTSDPNPAAAGSYDMTPVRSDGDYNPLNQGPIGSPFFDAPGAQQPDNPNTSSQFSQGAIGQSLEW